MVSNHKLMCWNIEMYNLKSKVDGNEMPFLKACFYADKKTTINRLAAAT